MKITNQRLNLRSSRTLLALACGKLLLCQALACFAADNPPATHVPERLLLKPKATARESVVHALYSKHGLKQREIIHQLDVRVLEVKPGQLDKVLARLKRNRHVEFVE